MDTVSLLVSRHARGASRWILLVGLVYIGLTLLVVAGLDVHGPLPPTDGDYLLAPFRWHALPRGLA